MRKLIQKIQAHRRCFSRSENEKYESTFHNFTILRDATLQQIRTAVEKYRDRSFTRKKLNYTITQIRNENFSHLKNHFLNIDDTPNINFLYKSLNEFKFECVSGSIPAQNYLIRYIDKIVYAILFDKEDITDSTN